MEQLCENPIFSCKLYVLYYYLDKPYYFQVVDKPFFLQILKSCMHSWWYNEWKTYLLFKGYSGWWLNNLQPLAGDLMALTVEMRWSLYIWHTTCLLWMIKARRTTQLNGWRTGRRNCSIKSEQSINCNFSAMHDGHLCFVKILLFQNDQVSLGLKTYHNITNYQVSINVKWKLWP